MVRIVKWALGIAAALIIVIAVAAVAAVMLFDPENYREEIQAELTEVTGREVTIGGEMSMSLFPWVAVRTGDIRVASAPAFGPEPMLALERVEAGVRLLPLFAGRVEIGTVVVDGFALRLATRGDGMTSWEDLLDREPAEPERGRDRGARGETGEISIASVKIRDASVVYVDALSGAEYGITDFELSLSDFALDTATPIDARFTFNAAPANVGGTLELSAVLEPGDLDAPRIRDLDLEGTLQTDALSGPQRVSLSAESIAGKTADNTLSLDGGRFSFGPIEGTIRLSGSGPAAPLALGGRMTLEEFSPREAAAVFGVDVDTADPEAFEAMALAADLELGYEAIAVSIAEARLDETVLAGRVALDRVGEPTIRFELAGGVIDLDRYLPPAEDAAADADAGDAVVATALPVDLIRSLSARGSLKFERLTLGGLPFEQLELGLDVGGDRARLYPVSATVLEGSYRGDVSIDARGNTPVLSLDERAEGVDLGALARVLWEKDNVEGTLAGRFVLRGRGETLADVRETLAGNVELLLSDGALTGTDLWHAIRSARARFKGETVPPAPQPLRTPFTSVRATAVVADGVARNDDLFAELPFLQLTGSGTVNLADATIDYGLRARVLERPDLFTDASAEELDAYTEAVIPLRLTGAIASPTVRPDIEGMVRDAAKQKIEEEKDRLRRRLLDKLVDDDEEDEAKKLLKDIFD